MVKNICNIKVLHTFILCFFVFAMFYSSIHDFFQNINIDNINVVNDFENNKSEKEIDKKIEFEDEFVKTVLIHHFNSIQPEMGKFNNPTDDVSSGNKRILIPPPRYLL
jgi:hypothetical protein